MTVTLDCLLNGVQIFGQKDNIFTGKWKYLILPVKKYSEKEKKNINMTLQLFG